MAENTLKMHPLLIVAATTVILTCLLAIAILTGILPSPTAREREAARETATAPAPAPAPKAALNANRSAVKAPASEKADHPPTGSTSGSGSSQSIAGSGPAANAPVVCNECGHVTSVRTVKQQGEAGLLGPIAGGAIGGLLGNQVGHGTGKTIATVVGAAGGAAAGTEIERRSKSTLHYVVGVRFNDGTTRDFTYGNEPGVQTGDRVKLVGGKLLRD
jgi:outer membrane lipoprotein SlyB